MSRLSVLFEKKPSGVLNVYCTAGYPQLESTLEIIKSLQKHGADIIELGIPYSDPLADGPVIQMSNTKAIQNGMTIKKLFDQLKDFRKNPAIGNHLPVVLMGYMNPVLQYGFEKFCSDAKSVGVDGLILPDLPEFEFQNHYGAVIKKYGLVFIFLVTPETSEQRVRKLDELSSGFLYAVSSSSITGTDKNIDDLSPYLQKLKALRLKNPILTGFGIRDNQTFKAACAHANGAIIGSAYIKAIENVTDINAATRIFLSSVLPS